MKPFVLIAALGLLALGGCAVGSSAPLFQPADFRPHGLAEGRWAMYGPGCKVRPAEPIPECAVPVEVNGAVMTLKVEDVVGAMGAPPGAMPPMNTKKPDHSKIELVAGDPEILQMTKIRADDTPPATPDLTPAVTYAGFRTNARNAKGEVTDGVMWIIVCPKPPLPEGLHEGPACTADTPMAIRALAPHMKPFLSYYLTWIGP